ncbi:hypothetical protein, partial [Mycobacterium tuberculosis]|uniref:hypothetical protein n=1 Tax=Mycobacterium tuberculosis TaxID=1773 RepID=UPI0021C5DC10
MGNKKMEDGLMNNGRWLIRVRETRNNINKMEVPGYDMMRDYAIKRMINVWIWCVMFVIMAVIL